ncbi:hypothetical protein BG000_011898, partial [Podila horticola]
PPTRWTRGPGLASEIAGPQLVEQVWGYRKQPLYRKNPTPSFTLQEVFDRMEDIWDDWPPDFLHELYEELPTKMQEFEKTQRFSSRLKRGAGGRMHK